MNSRLGPSAAHLLCKHPFVMDTPVCIITKTKSHFVCTPIFWNTIPSNAHCNMDKEEHIVLCVLYAVLLHCSAIEVVYLS